MPTLIDAKNIGVITCRDVLKAFGDAHQAHPNYEQADCQTFAKNVFLKIAPGESSNFVEDDEFF